MNGHKGSGDRGDDSDGKIDRTTLLIFVPIIALIVVLTYLESL
ncbi:hypothetical protein QM716_17340 [Rhodococcus sp. IEGM 1409]|nr:hypothetical protein [Rhodococcus sp. IEGM 1409]MDI9901624.1 hypothetical protein [Rhodococcus sp. IEGM 1409]